MESARAGKKILQEASALRDDLNKYNQISEEIEELKVLLELSEESEDPELASELDAGLFRLSKAIKKWEQETLFTDPHDKRNALVSLHAGAGGTETRIGLICSCACMDAGHSSMVFRWKCWITSRGRGGD